MSLIVKIYQLPQTVFTFKDLVLLFREISPLNLKRRINYLVKTKQLLNPKPGIYTKENFDPVELGGRIYTPSYVSLETVLAAHGIIFQYYETIYYASYLTREIKVGSNKFYYRRLPRKVLTVNLGIENNNSVPTASKERAFLDAVYLYKNYHFDNLSGLDWEKVFELVKMYESKIFEKRVQSYYGNK
ncbi:MAG: hypothetical protein Q7S14_03520 [bacterium]|nr:hypothetical protein [bacterium]